MFILHSFLFSIIFSALNLIYLKTYQLENYRVKNYLKKIIKLNFSIGRKNRLKFTKRIKRLIFIEFLLNFLYFLIIFRFIFNFWILFATIFLFILFSGLIVCISFWVASPIENLIKMRYIKKAKKKLASVGCKKIAITGSFGKTSTKNILYQILQAQFDVCQSPQSFNTPMGICKTILENLKETDDFLILEYGARYKGDIEFLAKNFGVDFAIITPIGNCHQETFGSVDNIASEKFKLCENAQELVVFNGTSKITKKLFDKCEKKKYLVCDKKGFAYTANLETNSNGTKFDLIIDGKSIKCTTNLLGKSSIDNIVVASTMAYLVGEDLLSIQKAIKTLKPAPHRLELIKGEVVDVIDDSYNSNVDGFEQALDILKTFDGRKIVVSPGIVELGNIQFETNRHIGSKIAKVADAFIIMNRTNKKALLEGAIESGMQQSNIFFASTRTQQKEILKQIISKGDVVLFENDFPDNLK